VRRELPVAGVSCKLPSHFVDLSGPEEAVLASQLGEGRRVVVALRAFPIGGQEMAAAMKHAEAELLKSWPDASAPKDVRSLLGKGRGLGFTNEFGHHDIERYPLGKDRILRVRVIGTQEAKKTVAQDVVRFKASFKRLSN
jgi:hypothetical protein